MQQLLLPAREIRLAGRTAAARPAAQQGEGHRVRLVQGDRAGRRTAPVLRARVRASDRAGIDASAGTSAGPSQPAAAYTASSPATALSRRRRIHTASHTSSPNTGAITQP